MDVTGVMAAVALCISIVGLYFARESARSAATSAQAAQEATRIAREEADNAIEPRLRFHVAVLLPDGQTNEDEATAITVNLINDGKGLAQINSLEGLDEFGRRSALSKGSIPILSYYSIKQSLILADPYATHVVRGSGELCIIKVELVKFGIVEKDRAVREIRNLPISVSYEDSRGKAAKLVRPANFIT